MRISLIKLGFSTETRDLTVLCMLHQYYLDKKIRCILTLNDAFKLNIHVSEYWYSIQCRQPKIVSVTQNITRANFNSVESAVSMLIP